MQPYGVVDPGFYEKEVQVHINIILVASIKYLNHIILPKRVKLIGKQW